VSDIYVVVVEANLVSMIERKLRHDSRKELPTALETGTALAARFRAFGCIDGRYEFGDASGARLFSVLCLQFTKAIAERRMAGVEALPTSFDSYVPDDRARSGPES